MLILSLSQTGTPLMGCESEQLYNLYNVKRDLRIDRKAVK